MKMRKILAILQAIVLLAAMTAATGCVIQDPGWGGGHWHHWHEHY
jgi:hypothetical protein